MGYANRGSTMALINLLEIYNADRHLIINNKYKNLRLLRVDKLPAPSQISEGGGNWKWYEYEIDFNMQYIPAVYCGNPQYYVIAELNGGKMTVQVHAPMSVPMTPAQVHDAVTLYIFTEKSDPDISGAGLFIWDSDTKELVFNSKTPYLRVVGSHIKHEISTNDTAGIASVMPETTFPCGKVAAIMFSMHEFQRSTPQVVVHSSLKLNWVNSNSIKSQWLADSAIVNPGGDIHIPGGVLRITCILFVNVTGY